MFIPYTDTLLIAGTTTYDEDTGEAILGDDFSVPARIIYESHLVCNKQGDQIVAAITAHFKPMVFDRVEYIEKNIVEALIKR